VLVLGAAAQAFAVGLSGRGAVAVTAGGLVLLNVFAVANLHLTGMGVLAIGLAANLLVITVNGGMPVREKALVAAGLASSADVASVQLDGARHVESSSDYLMPLADIIPIPAFDAVVSFGDLIVAVALADVVAHLVRRQRKREPVIDLRAGTPVIAASPAPTRSTTGESPPSRGRRRDPSTPPAQTSAHR